MYMSIYFIRVYNYTYVYKHMTQLYVCHTCVCKREGDFIRVYNTDTYMCIGRICTHAILVCAREKKIRLSFMYVYVYNTSARKVSWNIEGVEPGNEEGPG